MSEKWGPLLDRLSKLTRKGAITWNISSDDTEIFTDLDDFKVEIEESIIYTQYELRLFNSSGKLLDKFTDDELSAAGHHSAFSQFKDLFAYVRRVHSGAEKALDDLLGILDKKSET